MAWLKGIIGRQLAGRLQPAARRSGQGAQLEHAVAERRKPSGTALSWFRVTVGGIAKQIK
jgi:hypothetical protein